MSIHTIIGLALAAALLVFVLRPRRSAHYRVLYIVDGDTIAVDTAEGERRVRIVSDLGSIDAPELGQDHGQTSRLWLRQKIERRAVTLKPKSIDQYGRFVASVHIEGLDIGRELVRHGHAWGRGFRLGFLQLGARLRRRGLWALGNAVDPYDFRLSRR